MNRKYLRYLAPVFGFAVFALAAVVLYHDLKIYRPREILESFENLPLSTVLPALVLSLLSYAFATGYDFLAARYVEHRRPYGNPNEAGKLSWKFKSMADRYGGWPVFYAVAAAHVHRYLDMGLNAVSMGKEARVPLETFALDGS